MCVSPSDEQVLILYKELFFRHLYAKMTPSVDDKFDSFQNYVDLFNMLLGLDTSDPAFELPATWLWDMIDEFIYQFQTFHLFRNKVADLTEGEVTMLQDQPHMWSAQTVIQYLHALVRKAGIDLSKKASEQDPEADGKTISPMFKSLGYFSLIGLLRVNALLCDYPSALQSLAPLDLRKHRSLFTSVLSCHVSLYYFMGLSYLMCRRYVDAIKVFCYFLTYTQRNKHVIARSSQVDLVQRRVDQMLGLLGIAYVLSGASNSSGSGNGDRDSAANALIDEAIFHDLRDKLDDKLGAMKSGDLGAFESVFGASAPKFLTVCAPKYEAAVNVHTDALQSQLRLFLGEVKSRTQINDLYSYLKLFTTISIAKLAVFLHTDEDATLALLLKLSHKSRSQRWVGGAPADFVWQQLNEVHFTVVKDTIYVTEQRAARSFGNFFIRQIYKFDDLTRDCKTLRGTPRR